MHFQFRKREHPYSIHQADTRRPLRVLCVRGLLFCCRGGLGGGRVARRPLAVVGRGGLLCLGPVGGAEPRQKARDLSWRADESTPLAGNPKIESNGGYR